MFKNQVDLIGFIGSDPETRQLESGASITVFSLATKTSWKNESGSYDSRTEWHRIVVWGQLAQFAGTLSKGAHVEVEGQLRHRTYQKEIAAGKKNVAVDMTISEIQANAIRKLDRNNSSAEREQETAADGAPD